MTGDSAKRFRFAGILAPASALVLGALVRLSYLLGSSFPLNDGGLFYLMTQELQQNGYRLPAYTAYNAAGIPFAYPPLGFYLADLLDALGPWSLLAVFRFLPLALNLLTIPAFYALARDLLAEPPGACPRTVKGAFPVRAADGAVLAFALLPGSFAWQIMGGGVTRALGLLLAVLAIQQIYLLYRQGGRGHLAAAMLLAAGALLSHLAMAWLVAISALLLLLAYGRNRAGIVRSLLLAAGVAVLSAPWWATVLGRHGLAPFLAAGRSPESTLAGLASLLMLSLTDEPLFPLLTALALAGALAHLARRRFLLPAWLALLFLLDPRTARTTASLPLALLAGVAVADLLLPGLRALQGVGCRKPGRLLSVLLAGLLVYGSVSSMLAGLPFVQELAPAERQALRWVATNTPADSTFLVLTGDRIWGGDRTSEWFPVLARRRSVATVQGREWLPGFEERARSYIALQACATQDAECLERWAAAAGVEFAYIYVAKRPPVAWGSSQECCTGLLGALRCAARYRIVYEGPGAAVFARNPAAAGG